MSETMIGHSEASLRTHTAARCKLLHPNRLINTERWKAMIIILTMINTILVAIIAGLQTDANIRANDANRDSQYYAVLTSGELQRIGLQNNYDMNTFARILDNSQRSLVMGFTALEQLQNGDETGAAFSNRAGTGRAGAGGRCHQIFHLLSGPALCAEELLKRSPISRMYLDDSNAKALELLASQNAASDAYKIWSGKSDSYVAVLTILAIAFFLFGIAQSVNPRLRLLFAGFGIVVIVLGVGWALAILVG